MEDERQLHSNLSRLLSAPEPSSCLRPVKGLPKLKVLVGEALPALPAKVRETIPASTYLLHIHPPCPEAALLRASRPQDERTLFLEIAPGDQTLAALSGLLKALRPAIAELVFQRGRSPELDACAARVQFALNLEMPNLQVDRISALTRFRASLVNLGLMGSAPKLSAKLAKPGVPALVVGAGPSLEDSMDAVKRLAKRFAIVACGHAAIKMKQAGLEPDFAVEADPRCRINWSRFQGELESPLVLLSCADPAVAARFKRRLWRDGDSPEFTSLCEELGLSVPKIAISRGVVVTALDFAFSLGCERVALVGCDLALSADGASHAGLRRADGDELTTLEVPGTVEGSTVRTTLDFDAIRIALQSYLEQSGRRASVVNCSPSGARVEGVERMSLEAFAEPFPETEKPFEFSEDPAAFAGLPAKLRDYSSRLKKWSAASGELAEASRRLARELSNSVFDQARFKKAKSVFDQALDAEASTARGVARAALLAKAKASDVVDETPGSCPDARDASSLLRLHSRKAALAAALCDEISGDVDASASALEKGSSSEPLRDPSEFRSFLAHAVPLLAKSNPELAKACEGSSLPAPEAEGFRLHLRFEDVPHVSKLLPDGSLQRFSGFLSARREAQLLIDAFAAKFDPAKNFAVIVAPGNYAIVEEFAARFPVGPCVLLEPWPSLLSELLKRCAFLHRLPEGSSVIASSDSFKSWRKILSQAVGKLKGSGLSPLLLTNPKSAALPEVAELLRLEELS